MAKTNLRKELEKQDPEELHRLLLEVATRFPVAKMYLQMEFGLDSEPVIARYKAQIEKEFFPKRGYGKARSSRINRTLKEFGLVVAFREDMVDMLWYTLDLALKYHKTYGYFYDPFLNLVRKLWTNFLEMAEEEGLLGTYREQIGNCLKDLSVVSPLGLELTRQYKNQAGTSPDAG